MKAVRAHSREHAAAKRQERADQAGDVRRFEQGVGAERQAIWADKLHLPKACLKPVPSSDNCHVFDFVPPHPDSALAHVQAKTNLTSSHFGSSLDETWMSRHQTISHNASKPLTIGKENIPTCRAAGFCCCPGTRGRKVLIFRNKFFRVLKAIFRLGSADRAWLIDGWICAHLRSPAYCEDDAVTHEHFLHIGFLQQKPFTPVYAEMTRAVPLPEDLPGDHIYLQVELGMESFAEDLRAFKRLDVERSWSVRFLSLSDSEGGAVDLRPLVVPFERFRVGGAIVAEQLVSRSRGVPSSSSGGPSAPLGIEDLTVSHEDECNETGEAELAALVDLAWGAYVEGGPIEVTVDGEEASTMDGVVCGSCDPKAGMPPKKPRVVQGPTARMSMPDGVITFYESRNVFEAWCFNPLHNQGENCVLTRARTQRPLATLASWLSFSQADGIDSKAKHMEKQYVEPPHDMREIHRYLLAHDAEAEPLRKWEVDRDGFEPWEEHPMPWD